MQKLVLVTVRLSCYEARPLLVFFFTLGLPFFHHVMIAQGLLIRHSSKMRDSSLQNCELNKLLYFLNYPISDILRYRNRKQTNTPPSPWR
jgi:hypothetical protein